MKRAALYVRVSTVDQLTKPAHSIAHSVVNAAPSTTFTATFYRDKRVLKTRLPNPNKIKGQISRFGRVKS
jgi:hypothetical protein